MFDTVDGKLLTNTEVQIPDWIKETKFKKPVKAKLDVSFNTNIINRTHAVAERSFDDLANVRELKYTLSAKQLQVFAMNDLAKFLRQYRYEATASSKENAVDINVMFVNNPFEYTFTYSDVNGKVVANKTFKTKFDGQVNEYPYSYAGIEDSIEDSKNIDRKKSVKVANKNIKYSIISKYDIVQRCNNYLGEAKKIIEKHLNEGNIVAVGSNEYATVYDTNLLFPDLREEFKGEVSHMADFVDNHVATASYENKTANRLAMESCKVLGEVFNVEKIAEANREGDNLYVTAYVTHNNVRDKISVAMSIENERVGKIKCVEDADSNRYSVAQILAKFGENDKKIVAYLNGKDKHVAGGYIYSAKAVKAQLGKVMSHDNINKMLNLWVENGFAEKVNTTTYASRMSLAEMVQRTNAEFLSDDKIEEILHASATFGNDAHFHKYFQKDNDTRNKEAVAVNQAYKGNVEYMLGKYFNNINVHMLSKDKFVVEFMNENGKKQKVSASLNDGNILFKVGNKNVTMDKMNQMFKTSELLKAYAKDVDEDLSKVHKMVISKKQFVDNVKDYLTEEQTNELIDNLVSEYKLVKVASDKYVSEYQFKDLLKSFVGDFDKNLKQENIAKANRTTLKELVRNYITDGDTRNQIALSEKEAKFANNYKKVAKYLNNFKLNMVSDDMGVINFCTDNNEWGKRKIAAKFAENGVQCKVGSKWVGIELIPALFKSSAVLKAYVKDTKASVDNHSIVISKRQFVDKMSDYVTEDDINAFIKLLTTNKKLTQIASNLYVSDNSFEELLSEYEGNVDEGIKTDNLNKKNRLADKEVESDYIEDGDTRKPQKMLSESEFKAQFEHALPSHIACKEFRDISINETAAKCKAVLFNKQNGLSVLGSYDIAVTNGQLDKAFGKNADAIFDLTTINKVFNKYNHEKREAKKRIISKRYLKEKLNKIAYTGDLDAVFNNWEKKGLAERIDGNTYATEYTVDELLAKSNILAYKEEEIQNKFDKASAIRQIIPKQYHVQDSDSKSLANVADCKTDDEIQKVKAYYKDKLNQMVEDNVVTASRVEKLYKKLDVIKEVVELSDFGKELERYMR